MKIERVNILGLELERWHHLSCMADFGVAESFATLYSIQSQEEGKGHATSLLEAARAHYEHQGLKFGGSVALNERMKSIYERLGIEEYDRVS